MSEMAVAWTAIGLLAATLFGTLYYLGSKIDTLGARLDGRIDALGARLDTRMDALTSMLQAHIERHPS
jgi:hypothetical protein